MREEQTDLWAAWGLPGHRIAISTNGFIKKNGEAVMGRGCALQGTLRFPGLAARLGVYIRRQGNTPGYLLLGPESGPPPTDRLMILPVKHNWWEKADIELIVLSRDFLMREGARNPDWTFHVPRLGCGNGKLNWATEVRPLMEILPDNCIVHS
jgi:hypothetical protein